MRSFALPEQNRVQYRYDATSSYSYVPASRLISMRVEVWAKKLVHLPKQFTISNYTRGYLLEIKRIHLFGRHNY